MKVCSHCNIEKPLIAFYAKRPDCKECVKARSRKWHANNKEYANANRLRRQMANPEQHRENCRKWSQKHRAERTAYALSKRRGDTLFRLKANLRSRLNCYVKASGNVKSASAVRDLGCTISEFKAYLESKFERGMTWENYGKDSNSWSIDHIMPLSKFDSSNLKQANHYTNLQPMWHLENLKKKDKYENISC